MKSRNKKLDKDQILDWFKSGEKSKNDWLIGTEHEKFLFFKKNYKRVTYNEKSGIKSILEEVFFQKNWNKVYEKDNLIALNNSSGASISLEPGGQLELSGAPLKNLHLTCKEASEHLSLMKSITKKLDLLMLGIGHDPVSSRDEIPWMPKERYKIMRDYMPSVGNLGLDMMTRTCTIQVNLDYSSEDDMIKKFRTSLALQPISTAIFANSPFVDGKPSGYLSKRAFIWTDTDAQRTGIPSCVFEDNFGYSSWIDYLMSVPMYFISRNGKYIDVKGEKFLTFMRGKLKGFEDSFPTLADWENHTTTAFPEVRLKQYLEMRGADGGPWKRICALPAFWVGILYDDIALNDAYRLCKNFMKVNELEKSRISAAKFGLNGRIGNVQIREIAKQILEISYLGLKRRNYLDQKGVSETQFLDPLFNIVNSGETPAEEMLYKYENYWDKNIHNIFLSEVF